MLIILYIEQAFCNQTLPPGSPTQQILLVFVFIYNIYHTVIYFYIFFLFLNKLFQNYILNFIYNTNKKKYYMCLWGYGFFLKKYSDFGGGKKK